MMGITSNSQSGVGLNESSALSHVYIPHPPLKCSVSGSTGLYYDDGNKLLLCPTSDQVFKWNTGLPSAQDSLTSDLIDEGPVLSIKYSLDGKVIGIQRSVHEIQFRDKETGQVFSQRCKPESESILGFFWTDCPNYDVVFVKTSGLDMFSYEHELKTLRLVGTKKSNVSWYVYTHESRMVLLASGMQCKAFTGFQFSSGGIIKLPLFDMSMAKAEDNQKPVLAKEDVHIVTIYGRIYCLQVDRVAMLLNMYRFYRDAVIKQSSLPIYSSKIAVSVIDNVLLVHQVDAKVVILYDVFSDTRSPISAPLPLLFRGLPKNNTSIQTAHRESGNLNDDDEAVIYGNGWTFLVPNLICDVAHGNLWRIHLDLEAIAASSSDAPSVLELLQRRKLEPIKAKNLCLAIIRTLILERRPVPMVSKAIDVLVSTYSHSIKMGVPLRKNTVREEGDSTIVTNPEEMEDAPSEEGANPEELSSSQLSQESEVISAAVSPDELYSLVFLPIEEEMAVDPAYMVSVIIEFFRSVGAEKLKVHPNLYVMTIQLLARSERYAEIGLFVVHKILEPSKEVALQLLDSGHQNLEMRKLGMDMLRQLSLHHDYVMLLVQDGYYLEALRYARRNQVNSIGPGLFLESAIAKNDSQHVAAILRFFSDFIPGFKDTSEYSRYCRTLSEMNSASSSSITV